MAIYEDSFSEVSTPFTSPDDGLFVDPIDYVRTPSGQWRELLPIFLALLAITTFIFVRPKVSTGKMVQNEVVLSDTEIAIENVATIKDQVSDTAVELGGSTTSLSPVFTREVKYWEPQILNWSAMYGVDPNIIATIMQIESCGNPEAESYAGAKGLFQVMPFHFAAGESMLDPETNAMRGLAFFNEQLRYTKGDIPLSFAGYNGGYAASGGNYPNWPNETQRYFYWAKGIYEEAISGYEESPTLSEWLAAGGAAGCQRAATRLGL